MGRITLELIRKRSEHHDGCLHDLQELSLPQQHLQQIELVGRVCPNLKLLSLQANNICKLEHLNRLKELQYLNVAMNKIMRVQGLDACEHLEKLDMTLNMVDLIDLSSISSLQANLQLRSLYLMGNPCTKWGHYRLYVIGMLPQLAYLDGSDVTRSECILAQQSLPGWQQELGSLQQLDSSTDSTLPYPTSAERASLVDVTIECSEAGNIISQAAIQMPKATLPEAEQASSGKHGNAGMPAEPKMPNTTSSIDNMSEERGLLPSQCNSGRWKYEIELEEQQHVRLRVWIGRFMNLSHVTVEVQPAYISIFVKGVQLLLHLPCPVVSGKAVASHSKVEGTLSISMPCLSTERLKSLHTRNTHAARPPTSNAASQQTSSQYSSSPAWARLQPADLVPDLMQ